MRSCVIAIFLFLSGLTADAYACSCLFPDGNKAKEYLAASKAVFVGKVLDIKEFEDEMVKQHADTASHSVARVIAKREITFQVQEAWKGVDSGSVTIGAKNGDICMGYPFVLGESYLVFTNQDALEVDTMCSPTVALETAAGDPNKEPSSPIPSPSDLMEKNKNENKKKFFENLGKPAITFEHKE